MEMKKNKKINVKKSKVKVKKIKPEREKNVKKEIKEIELPSIIETFGVKDKDLLDFEKIKKTYWTDETEDAVKEYLRHDFNYYQVRIDMHLKKCKKENKKIDEKYVKRMQERLDATNTEEHVKIKNQIYDERIQHPFNKLVENIIFNFRLFRTGVDVETLHDDGVSFLYQKLSHFDPEVQAKSFSYYGTIVKHYLQNEKKRDDDTIYTFINYDTNQEESDSENTEEIDSNHPLDLSQNLFNYVVKSMEDDMKAGRMSANEVRVGDSILKILRGHEIIGVYNRNQLYALIRESTALPNKDITYALSRFRAYYTNVKEKFMREKGKID